MTRDVLLLIKMVDSLLEHYFFFLPLDRFNSMHVSADSICDSPIPCVLGIAVSS